MDILNSLIKNHKFDDNLFGVITYKSGDFFNNFSFNDKSKKILSDLISLIFKFNISTLTQINCPFQTQYDDFYNPILSNFLQKFNFIYINSIIDKYYKHYNLFDNIFFGYRPSVNFHKDFEILKNDLAFSIAEINPLLAQEAPLKLEDDKIVSEIKNEIDQKLITEMGNNTFYNLKNKNNIEILSMV